MKYLITESQFESYVWKYLDRVFSSDSMISYNDSSNTATMYVIGDPDEEDDRMTYYTCEYFDDHVLWHKDICPFVVVDKDYFERLDNYFGDVWKDVFKKWFEVREGKHIKTVLSYSNLDLFNTTMS